MAVVVAGQATDTMGKERRAERGYVRRLDGSGGFLWVLRVGNTWFRIGAI